MTEGYHRPGKYSVERRYERLCGKRALLQTHYLFPSADLEYIKALEKKVKAAELRFREGR